jgi:two-component system invasion response regulator UvrY
MCQLPATPGKIRVAIADDHAIVRAALRGLIDEQADLECVGEASDGRGAIDLARTLALDVLILDVSMPGQGGLDCLAMIRAKAPELGVLVFSMYHERHYAAAALRQGARGYLSKECDPEEVLRAVRTIAAGRRYITQDVAEAIADHLGHPERSPHAQLNEREMQLLLHLARGAGSTQVAQDLSLSPRTVSTYRTALLKKLGLKTDSELTRYALRSGLLD